MADDTAASPKTKVSDVIPRVTLGQIFAVLQLVASKGRGTFEDARQTLQQTSQRRSPSSKDGMWTSTRDTLAELARLGYATVGPLPRKRSEIDRLRGSPWEATGAGKELAELHAAKPARGFDTLLVRWANEHPYFRTLVARLAESPIYVPDITSIRQIGEYDGAPCTEITRRVVESCLGRLRSVQFDEMKARVFEQEVGMRLGSISKFDPRTLRTEVKSWIDFVQDSVVLPAFLAAESLPFDQVTFQHLIRVSNDFLALAWTSSHPAFAGRIIFATCEFVPPVTQASVVTAVTHRGKSWAADCFEHALRRAYATLSADRPGAYVDAYAMRAIVCTDLGIQPRVFELCLDDFVRTPQPGRPLVYTELPMRTPSPGESYVKLGNSRVGLIKLVV